MRRPAAAGDEVADAVLGEHARVEVVVPREHDVHVVAGQDLLELVVEAHLADAAVAQAQEAVAGGGRVRRVVHGHDLPAGARDAEGAVQPLHLRGVEPRRAAGASPRCPACSSRARTPPPAAPRSHRWPPRSSAARSRSRTSRARGARPPRSRRPAIGRRRGWGAAAGRRRWCIRIRRGCRARRGSACPAPSPARRRRRTGS